MQGKRNNKRFFISAILILNSVGLFAQQAFKYTAKLAAVDSNGYYAIRLAPQVLAKARRGLADLRIFDGNGKPIAYLLDEQVPQSHHPKFFSFPIVSATKAADTASLFIVENAAHTTIDKLYLGFRNTAVHRVINLSGSDDMKRWYAIDENKVLQLSEMASNGNGEQELNFPPSSYRFYKIQVVNGHKEPIAIIRAGIYKTLLPVPGYDLLPTPVITRHDSAKTTTFSMRLSDDFVVDKIKLVVSSPRLFNRRAIVYAGSGIYLQPISDTTISSTNAELWITAKTKQIAVKVFNNDNPPLGVTTAMLYSRTRFAVAYLEKGQHYDLVFGDENATAPDYDLKFFKDSLGNSISQLSAEKVENNPLHRQPVAKEHYSVPSWLLWLSIGVVIVLLGLSTVKMMKEVNKRE